MVALIALVAVLHLTAAENNKLFTVTPRTPIVVTLPSNASTGYHWKLTVIPAGGIVRSVSHRYVAPKSNRPGAPGKEIWRFRAAGKGGTVLGLGYVRSWQAHKPARRFVVKIRVR
ncbi:MAG TPA: protease inhibitor I42 family protein [Gaiellaceae bacterium]|nr:protease inhibitor I42 family protein [Gaiellaceae bacterium]